MSVKFMDRPIPDSNLLLASKHLFDMTNVRTHPVSQSLQHWQIGRNRLEWQPEQTFLV